MPPRPFTETHAVPRRPRTPERARDAFFRARAPPRARDEAAWRVRRLRAPRAPILSPFERQLVKPPFERLVRHPATSTPPSRPRASRAVGRPRRARRSTRRCLRHRAGSPPRRRARARPRRRRRRPRLRSRRPSAPVVTVGPRDHRRVRGILPASSPRPRSTPPRRVAATPSSASASPRAARRDIHRGRRVRRGVPRPGSSGRVSAPGAIPRRRAALRVRILRRHAQPGRVRVALRPRAPPPHRALGTPGTLGHSRSRGARLRARAVTPRRALRPLSRGGGPAARPRARGCRRARHASPIRRGRVPSHGARRARRRRRARSRERLSIVRATRARLLQRRRREGANPARAREGVRAAGILRASHGIRRGYLHAGARR